MLSRACHPDHRSATPSSEEAKKKTLYENIPKALRANLLVRTKKEIPDETLRKRQEATRAKTPTELGNISSISDFPVPSSVENLFGRKRHSRNYFLFVTITKLQVIFSSYRSAGSNKSRERSGSNHNYLVSGESASSTRLDGDRKSRSRSHDRSRSAQ